MDSANKSNVPEFGIYHLPPDSRGPLMVSLNVSLMVISFVLLSARLYARAFMVRALGLDDLLSVLAMGLLTAASTLEVVNVEYGSGTHINEVPPDRIPTFFAHLTTIQLLYFLDTGMVRIAMAAFYPRLSQARNFVRCVYALIAFIAVQTLMAFFFVLFECKHVPDLWDVTAPGRQCISKAREAPMMWTHGALGIFIDLCLMALPIWVVAAKMKFTVKTVQVILVFCVGIFGVITGIIRLAIIVGTDFTTDTTYKMAAISWTDVEGHVGLWTGCFPALQPLLRLISYKLHLRSSPDSTRDKSRTAVASSAAAGGTSNNNNKQRPHAASVRDAALRSQGYVNFNDDDDDKAAPQYSHVWTGGKEKRDLEDVATAAAEADLEMRPWKARSVIHKKTEADVRVASAGGRDVEVGGGGAERWDHNTFLWDSASDTSPLKEGVVGKKN